MPPTFQDFDILTRTLYGESRGEPYCGKVAVAWTIKNRANRADDFKRLHAKPHPLFGDGTVRMVCQWPRQYSCWNENDPMRAKLIAAKTAQLAECLKAAYAVLQGEEPDPTNGALHYFNPDVASPSWANGLMPCAVIGAHRFFNNVP